MTNLSPIARRHFRRNWAAFFGDYVTFGIGLTFASTTTTLPAFAAALTDNTVLIGAVAAVWSGGWLLPQVFAANYLSNKPHKYPVMMWGQVIGRPILPLFVIWLLAGGVKYPELTIIFFLATLAFFVITDAPVALAWFDLFGKSLAAETRGRLIGLGQVTTGLGAVGAGLLIRHLLGPQGPAFPLNYAIIFGLASVCFMASLVACALIVEPPEPVEARRAPLRTFLPHLAGLLRSDRAFNRITLVRLLSGLSALATVFYVVHATSVLRLPVATIGLFAAATTVGTAIAGVVLGVVADRVGSHRVVQIVTWAAFSVPVLALVMHTGIFGAGVAYVYPVLFVLLGVFEGSIMLGFLSYTLEIAPPGQRPSYMGLTNTLSGLLVLVPVAGGLVLEHTSYPVLFACAAAGTLLAALAALQLPSPRGRSASDGRSPAPEDDGDLAQTSA